MFRVFLALFLLVAWPLAAQQSGAVLTVTGEGVVPVPPDMALVSVGVDMKSPTAKQALTLNSTRMAAILALLKNRNIPAKDIRTTQFSLRPVWNNRAGPSDKPPDISGFVVSNVVQIRLRNLDGLGPLLDALTKSGANRIEGIAFGNSNPAPYLDQARRRAVSAAIHKARLYAGAAGLVLGPILSMDEGRRRPGAIAARPLMRALSVAVPIAKGEQTLRVRITMRFSLLPRP